MHLAAPRAPGCILAHDERRARAKSGTEEVDLGCSCVLFRAGGCGLLVAPGRPWRSHACVWHRGSGKAAAAVLVHGAQPWAQR